MSKRIEWGSNEDFIKKYEELKSSRKMGEYYHCDKTSVFIDYHIYSTGNINEMSVL